MEEIKTEEVEKVVEEEVENNYYTFSSDSTVLSGLMNLSKKLNLLSKSLGKVTPDERNKFSNYDYISSNKIMGLLRDNLDKIGVAIIPELTEFKEEHFKNEKDKTTIRTTVWMNFTIIDTETGYYAVKKWAGADQDTGGKSFGQAVTECVKRFYFKLFHVSSSDEIDPDGKTTDITTNEQENKKPTGLKRVFISPEEKGVRDSLRKMKSSMLKNEAEGVLKAFDTENPKDRFVLLGQWRDAIEKRLIEEANAKDNQEEEHEQGT